MNQITKLTNFSYKNFTGNTDILFELDKNSDKYHWRKQDFTGKQQIIIATYGNIITGFVVYNNVDIIDILRIIVVIEYRGNGIAISLINILKNKNKNIMLEVRASNTKAIKLYNKYGFKQLSLRKNYYQNGENALIMIFIIHKVQGKV